MSTSTNAAESGKPDVEFRSQHPSQRRAELIAELRRRFPGIAENDLHDALEDIWIADIPIEELTAAEAVTHLEEYRHAEAEKLIAALGPVSEEPPIRKTHDDVVWQGTKVLLTVETDAKFLEHQLAQVIDAVMTLHPDLPIIIEILRPIADAEPDHLDAGSTPGDDDVIDAINEAEYGSQPSPSGDDFIPFHEDDYDDLDIGDLDRDDLNAVDSFYDEEFYHSS